MPEFSDMSLDDIGKCFLSVDSACIGVDTDTTHTAVRQAIGLSTEDKTVSEGVVTYDVKLLVQNPKTQEKSVLIINLEAQTSPTPSGWGMIWLKELYTTQAD